VTRDRARKNAIRARMAASGEPYSTAARRLGAAGPADDLATVRGTPCLTIAARAGSAEFTVWIDDEHIRRVQTEESGSSERISLSLRKTLELWDFGAEDVSAD
jgi:hypothetical protein